MRIAHNRLGDHCGASRFIENPERHMRPTDWRFILLFVGGPLFGCNDRPGSPPIVFPSELTRFQQIGEKPIFAGEPGMWDAQIRERGWIVHDGADWKLYYTGYDDPKGIRRLGLATSTDGLTWTRHPKNPLVANEWIEDVMIVRHADDWLLFAEGKDDQPHFFRSTDGLAWSRVGPVVITQVDGTPIAEGPAGTLTVFEDQAKWFLFYERSDQGVWHAESNTPLGPWRNLQDAPVLTPGPGEYDRDLIALNQIVKHEGRYYAFYHGCKNETDKSKRRWATCIATSTDLRNWTKFADNPIVPLAENRSSGVVVPLPGGFRLYTMHPAVWAYERRR